MRSEDIERVRTRCESQWMNLEGVVGVGIGESRQGKPIIIVYVEAMTEELRKAIPTMVDGFDVSIAETGELEAL